MKKLMLLSALALVGCYTEESPQPKGLASFEVTVKGFYVADSNPRASLPVVASCVAQHGGTQAAVPMELRGTPDCRLAMPRGPVDIDFDIQAVDVKGQPMDAFNGPVSFRTVPGNLTGPYRYRWVQLTNGKGTGTVRSAQLYGEAHVWVEDEPVQVDYAEGEVVAGELPEEPATRTFSTGLSRSMHFEEPTIATVQVPQNSDQLTAYNGTFMRIGRAPEAGSPLIQNCEPDDPNYNQPVTLLVTGTDPGGFFVTDLTACRVREGSIPGANTQTAEPSGFFPGRFNALYIYNYSFPEGLDPGDLLWSIAGSVQEFTATTQLTFPSWSIREKVRLLPQAEWNKYLALAPPTEINGRLCGFSGSPYITDVMCGYSYGNYKMEGLESSLVKIRRVKFPQVFRSCDANGNNSVPFFCPDPRTNVFGACGEDDPNDPDVPERKCNVDCTLGLGEYRGQICAEKTTYDNFGQFVVEMNPTGAAEAGLDATVNGRLHALNALPPVSPATEAWTRSSNAYTTGVTVNIWCDKAVNVRFGGSSVPGVATNVALAAATRLEHTLKDNQLFVWVSVQDAVNGSASCKVSQHPRTRINLVTKDAVPDLVVNCSETDADAERAEQCRFLHGATFDIVGHLRHVSAARPRWIVLPRDQDDLCCYPGPGMECPRPIEPCVNP
ncbi:hypothetical protein [Myxococcus sp. CA039A]|uniref:hypothetical protein n=1 Tax=Myxococcus sp. CA039A TaxID=2741737 RepID=UPI00157AF980|nr:hypothetical protein [Myxococcus sp. CA039A]NTX52683.1 hypothetical protein [Myxococcus sp. CA039A]